MDAFLERFPHCLEGASGGMPGPTEILFQETTGFCLYCGEKNTTTFNQSTCREVFGIAGVVNLTSEALDQPEEFADVVDQLRKREDVAMGGRGQLYAAASAALRSQSKIGLPCMVYDTMGEHHAPATAAWFMVEVGFGAEAALAHVQCMRGAGKKEMDREAAIQRAVAMLPSWEADAAAHDV